MAHNKSFNRSSVSAATVKSSVTGKTGKSVVLEGAEGLSWNDNASDFVSPSEELKAADKKKDAAIPERPWNSLDFGPKVLCPPPSSRRQ